MLKHSPSLSTLDQELFPGVREEKDTRLWLLRKWVFAMILSIALVYWSGPVWQTGAQRVEAVTGTPSLHHSAHRQYIAQAAQASLRPGRSKTSAQAAYASGRPGPSQTSTPGTARASVVIPRGTLIPVEIESTRLRGRGQTVILARTRSFVFPDQAVLIPAGSQVEGTAQRHAGKWEIHWHSVSVVSAEGREADIQARNEIPVQASLDGRSLLIKTK